MRFLIVKMQFIIFLKNNVGLSSSSRYLKIFLLKGTLNYRMSNWNVSYKFETLFNCLIENSLPFFGLFGLFCLFRATPVAYGGSQARVPVRAIAAGLY